MTVELNSNLVFNLTELDGGGFDSRLPDGTPATPPPSGGLTDATRLFTVNKTFEGTVGQNTKSNATGMDDWGGNTVFSSEQVRSGTTSGKMHVYTTDSNGGTFNWGGIVSFGNRLYEGDEFCLQFWQFMPNDFIPYTTGGGGHIKFTRIKTYTAADANGGLIDVYLDYNGSGWVYKYIKEFSPNTWHYFAPTSTYNHIKGRWVRFDQYYRLHSDPTQSKFIMWRDGVQLFNDSVQTLTNSTDYATDFYLYTYWNGTVPQDQFAYVDDIKITSDRSQMEVDPVSGDLWIGGTL